MNNHDYWMIAAFFALVLMPAPWLGRYLFLAMEGERTWLTPVLGPIERLCYRFAGIDEHSEQDWKSYSLALLALTAVSLVSLFAILMMQASIPLNPQAVPGMAWDLALNTAVSFVTNTNWQAYSGEAQLSYFSQMLGLGVQNFISPAVGLAVLVVLCRALSRRSANAIGNFWVDLTRAVLYGLLPFCVVLALVLVWQGVPQSFASYVQAVTLQGGEQTIPLGPAASQIAIKQLGTNGGGFFGVNSAHPFENPTAWGSASRWPPSIKRIQCCPAWRWSRAGRWRARRADSVSRLRRCGQRPQARRLMARSTPCMTVSARWAAWCLWSI